MAIPLCTHIKSNGTPCGSPAVSGTELCYHHSALKAALGSVVPLSQVAYGAFPPIPFLFPEDRAALQVNYFLLLQALNEHRIDLRTANMMQRILRSTAANLGKSGSLVDNHTRQASEQDGQQVSEPTAPEQPAHEQPVTEQSGTEQRANPGSGPQEAESDLSTPNSNAEDQANNTAEREAASAPALTPPPSAENPSAGNWSDTGNWSASDELKAEAMARFHRIAAELESKIINHAATTDETQVPRY